MAKIPDKAEHQRQFSGLEVSERRAIIRSVNRGKAVDQRKLAPLAVGVARRQQKFWRVAWVIGPLIGLTSLFGNADLAVALMNVGVATVALGLMSWFWYSRARRAEALNLELSQSRRDRERRQSTVEDDGPSAAQRFRSHLPGGGGGGASSGERVGKTNGSSKSNGSSRSNGTAGSTGPRRAPATTPPPGQRPYKPRGRKRR